MPFNLLLLPLLAGYLFTIKSRLHYYHCSQLDKERMLLLAATWGLIFAALSRAICVLALQTAPGQWAANTWHLFAPFPFIGTAIGSIIVGVIAAWLVNRTVSEQGAGSWLFHSGVYDKLEEMLYSGALGVAPTGAPSLRRYLFQVVAKSREFKLGILKIKGVKLRHRLALFARVLFRRPPTDFSISLFSQGEPKPILLTMKDNKVIVCLVQEMPPLSAKKPEFFRVLPLWTGYRDPITKAITRTTNYADKVQGEQGADFARVIRVAEIQYCSLFKSGIFAFDEPSDEQPAASAQPEPEPTARPTGRAAKSAANKKSNKAESKSRRES